MSAKLEISEAYLNSLPKKKIIYAGTERRVLMDKENNRIYLLDNQGKYTGKFANFQHSKPQVPEMQAIPLELDQSSEPKVAIPSPQEIEEKQSPSTESTPKRSRLSPVSVVLLLLAFITIFTFLSTMVRGCRKASDPDATGASTTSTSATTEIPTNNPTPSSPEQGGPAETVLILSPATDIFPGESLSKIKLNIVSITAAEYQSLSVTTHPYSESDATYLKNMVATQYIAAGQYLTYDNVGASYSPTNPWATMAPGKASLSLPVSVPYQDLTDYLWGNQVELEISVKSWGASPETTLLPEGIHASTSTDGSALVTIYHVQSAVIRDVFNNNGKDLYSQYYMTSQLPLSTQQDYLTNRYRSILRKTEDTPAMITVTLGQEQADFLSELDTDRMTVSITVMAPFCETSLQNDLYHKLQDAGQAIGNTMRTAS